MTHLTLKKLTKSNKRLARLEKLIDKVGQPGDYFANDLAIVPLPRIEIEPVGRLSFPVPNVQARELLAAGEQSPLGQGTDTIKHPKIDGCREFASKWVRISDKSWNRTFDQILNQALEGLGCSNKKIFAEFDKLLVCAPGGFHSRLHDTEKCDGMVASLVISLPVDGTGGDFVIRHQGREIVIDMTADNPSELAWVTYYAECEQEMRPVTTGHRIYLVYRLMVKPGKKIPTPPPDYVTMVKPVVQELMAFSRDQARGSKLVWVFDHDYSETGLSFDNLQNADKAIGKLLFEAAKDSDFVICTALMEVCDTHIEVDNHYAPDIHVETTAELTELQALLRSDVVPNQLDLYPGEMMPSGDNVLGFEDEEDYEDSLGYTSQEVYRIYRRTALVLWPRTNNNNIA